MSSGGAARPPGSCGGPTRYRAPAGRRCRCRTRTSELSRITINMTETTATAVTVLVSDPTPTDALLMAGRGMSTAPGQCNCVRWTWLQGRWQWGVPMPQAPYTSRTSARQSQTLTCSHDVDLTWSTTLCVRYELVAPFMHACMTFAACPSLLVEPQVQESV